MLSEDDEETEAYLLHAQYYLDVLRDVNKCYQQKDEDVTKILMQFDEEWLNIEGGQKRAKGYAAKEDAGAVVVMCIAYPWSGADVLGLRLAPSVHTEWLDTALICIEKLKTRLRKVHGSLQKDAQLQEWSRYLQDPSHYNLHSPQEQKTQPMERAAILWKTRSIERECRTRCGERYVQLGEYKQALTCQLQALNPLGYIRWWEWPVVLLREGLKRKIDLDPLMGTILNHLGDIYLNQGLYKQAISHYEQALKFTRTMCQSWPSLQQKSGLGNNVSATTFRQHEAGALSSLGLVYKHLGQYERARDYFQQALDISEELKDKHMEGRQLGNLGEVYRLLEQYDRAIDYHQQALAIVRKLDDKQGEGRILGNLGTTYSHSRQYGRALECYDQALQTARDIGDIRGEGDRSGNMGDVYMFQEDYERASISHQHALKIAHDIGNQRGEANTFYSLGWASLQQAQFQSGLWYLQQARDLFVSMGVKHKVRDIDRLMPYAQLGMQSLPCEVCSRRMIRYGAGEGYVLVSAQEQIIGIGTAEECWGCGRLYCDHCYPSRPPNICACGKGREKDRVEGKVHFRGSLHLIKVRYLSAPYLE